MFYQGKFALSDDSITFSILDSVLTTNPETQAFYLHIFNYAVNVADGALAEAMGSNCKAYFERNACKFIDLKTHKLYSANYQKWIDFTAFEYYFEINPYEAIDNAINQIKPHVASYCGKEYEDELQAIRLEMIEIIKENKD